MSRRVIGYVVRAYKTSGEVEEHTFSGTGWETMQRVQDKVNELEGQPGINAVYPVALYADQLPPPQPKQNHHREIAS